MNGRVNGELDAAEETISLDVGDDGAVGAQLAGTWVGTVSFEASINGGD